MNRLVSLVCGGGFGAVAQAFAQATAPPEWARTNFRGNTVNLSGGVGTAVSACAVAATVPRGRLRVAAALVTGVAAGIGAADDLDPNAGAAKGLRGHLKALARGEVTTGAAKLIGISTAALAAAAMAGAGQNTPGVGSSRVRAAIDTVISGGLIAGSANLANLFDLRPGRALKATAIAAAPLAVSRAHPAGAQIATAVFGVAAAAAPSDLAEETMLGDVGANALGALLGMAVATHPSRTVRYVSLAAIAGLTLASEKVSFSKVITSTPVLRELDAWGRLPASTEHNPGPERPVT